MQTCWAISWNLKEEEGGGGGAMAQGTSRVMTGTITKKPIWRL